MSKVKIPVKLIPVPSKKIEVNVIDCTGYGRYTCIKNRKHSWFNHSQDTFRVGTLSTNAPDTGTGGLDS